jgi:hypothetical protein
MTKSDLRFLQNKLPPEGDVSISYFFKLCYMRNVLCSDGLLAHSTRFNYSIPGAGVQIAIIDSVR